MKVSIYITHSGLIKVDGNGTSFDMIPYLR